MSERTESFEPRAAEEHARDKVKTADEPGAFPRSACGRPLAALQGMTGDPGMDTALAREICASCGKCAATNWFRAFLHDETVLRMRSAGKAC